MLLLYEQKIQSQFPTYNDNWGILASATFGSDWVIIIEVNVEEILKISVMSASALVKLFLSSAPQCAVVLLLGGIHCVTKKVTIMLPALKIFCTLQALGIPMMAASKYGDEGPFL